MTGTYAPITQSDRGSGNTPRLTAEYFSMWQRFCEPICPRRNFAYGASRGLLLMVCGRAWLAFR